MGNDAIESAIIGALGAVIATLSVFFLQRRSERKKISDKDLFQNWRIAFYRRAFKGKFRWTTNVGEFEKAIEDTIKAVITGFTTNADTSIRQGGKTNINNNEWSECMENIERKLHNILGLSRKKDEDVAYDDPHYKESVRKIDEEREEIIKILNSIWVELGIRPLKLPSETGDWEDA